MNHGRGRIEKAARPHLRNEGRRALTEVGHHDYIGFAATAGEGKAFAVGGPGEGEHVVVGEVSELNGIAAGQGL